MPLPSPSSPHPHPLPDHPRPGPSRRPITLIRSTDAHPPLYAHFDVPEGTPHPQENEDESDHLDPSDKERARPRPVFDIEHVPCDNDPREWSAMKKNVVLGMMTVAVVGPLLAPSIYNPVIDDLKADLHATETQIGLSLSMYILFQGWIPILWATIAEIVGRKLVYIVSYSIYTVGCIVASRAPNMQVLIAMRVLQAFGSSAVVSVGAGSLADMFEPHERGRKLGIFYGMPLLGPSIGPLLGGALGSQYGWRSAFYFLSAFAGLVAIMFIFFPDTWRKERSRVYEKAMEGAVKRALHHDEAAERKRQRKRARGLDSKAATPPMTPFDGAQTPVTRRASEVDLPTSSPGERGDTPLVRVDVERGEVKVIRRRWFGLRKAELETEHEAIHPTLRDVNPLPAMWSIWKRPTNVIILLSSGILFAAFYTVTYTAAVTLAKAPYDYSALIIGVVILSFGVGSMAGSLVGGRYSDWMLRRVKQTRGGVVPPEARLRSTLPGMPLIVASYLTYGWTTGEKVHVAGIVVALFFSGFSLMIIYSSTLAYLVDSNPGRSASAVSCNSSVRGSFACIMSQVAIPLQNAIGDGGLYTLIAGLLALSSGGILLLVWKGEDWRQPDHRFPWRESVGAVDPDREEISEKSGEGRTGDTTRVTSTPSGEEGNAESAEPVPSRDPTRILETPDRIS